MNQWNSLKKHTTKYLTQTFIESQIKLSLSACTDNQYICSNGICIRKVFKNVSKVLLDKRIFFYQNQFTHNSIVINKHASEGRKLQF